MNSTPRSPLRKLVAVFAVFFIVIILSHAQLSPTKFPEEPSFYSPVFPRPAYARKVMVAMPDGIHFGIGGFAVVGMRLFLFRTCWAEAVGVEP